MTASAPQLTNPPSAVPPRRVRPLWIVLGALLVLITAATVVLGLSTQVLHGRFSRPVPSFASLASAPDPSLHGTVAYYDSQTGCIRLVAAAGRPSRQLWCLPAEGPSIWVTAGKPVGPQLAWRPDGRLEVTMFRMKLSSSTTKGPEGLNPGWQKLIDVRTGVAQDLPAADAPTAPNTSTEPTVSPAGERVGYRFDPTDGKVTVSLTTSGGTRTLLSVRGPGEYTYDFGPVFWAPDWRWIAAADPGRILIVTPGVPSVTRVLVTGAGGGAGGGTAGPTFAVTARDLF